MIKLSKILDFSEVIKFFKRLSNIQQYNIEKTISGYTFVESSDDIQNILNNSISGIIINQNINLTNRYRDWETDRKSTRLNSSH